MRQEKPSFDVTIPAKVRYDDTLIPNAKLIYGEIKSLAYKNGYCYA